MTPPIWSNSILRSLVWLGGAALLANLKLPEGAGFASVRTDSQIWIGIVLILLGIALHIWSNARLCRGEYLATIVREGPYAVVRNPIYLAGLLILSGVCFLYTSPNLADFFGGVVLFLFFHFRVTRFEEPSLLHKFGQLYKQYCADVPRWLPGENKLVNWVTTIGRTK